MERITQFAASFFKITTNREGESRVIFEVPLTEMPSVLRLLLCVGKPLVLTIDKGQEAIK